ncbi:Flavin reductase domain protein FMN-binding [uncultured Alphaproteobacteria bacterium]|uniref:Flavin reductase domain protein FMN-binding n=1 Tax=uncultured Alphaproteobacteria bacterium TaxID=91750 RepID=A0A212KMQ8_9PROT|nr:Flavin reductase domain protein FMN-binding [uncultured Alphaproteobacteria bacterium]
MDPHVLPVALDRAYRLINHGPTVLVSAAHDGVADVMTAAWACALDFSPPKLTVVIDKASRTRALLEKSGGFAVQVPTAAQARLALGVGSVSLADAPDKLASCGVDLFRAPDCDLPLVAGCSAWLACRVISEPHNQQTYDLFIGEVTAAWADSRAFADGRWRFESADPAWRSLHHVAGGHFYAIGNPVDLD